MLIVRSAVGQWDKVHLAKEYFLLYHFSPLKKKKDASQVSVHLVKLLISALADVWHNTKWNNLLSAVRVVLASKKNLLPWSLQ